MTMGAGGLTETEMHGKMGVVEKKSTDQRDARSFFFTTELIARTSTIVGRGAALLP